MSTHDNNREQNTDVCHTCFREADIAVAKSEIADLKRRCDTKEVEMKEIRNEVIPNTVANLVKNIIEPIIARQRKIEGWNRYAMGWAAGFGLIAVFIANKLWA